MVASSFVAATLATLFVSPSLGAALPAAAQEQTLAARGGGWPASNPPGVTCYNTWETVTNDPVVQYWYVTAKDAENSIKADRVWNHLNLNGCAPTEHKYHAESSINGATLTFHTSEACTADRVSKAIRSGSDPGVNIACDYTGKGGPSAAVIGNKVAGAVADGVVQGLLEGLMGLGKLK